MNYFIGIAVSLIVEGIKKYFGTNEYGSLLAVAVLSLVSAIVFQYLGGDAWFQGFGQTLVVAGGFHNFIIRRFN